MRKIILLGGIFLFGALVPFIPSMTVVELFFLLIPFVMVFLMTLLYLVITLFNKNLNSRKALFIFSVLPVFIIAQFSSGFTIDKVQRFRSDGIIADIEQVKNRTGKFPESYRTSLGIKYQKKSDQDSYQISYSRGFMVLEKYRSNEGKWESYGWND
ncbi:hypothetical protein [Pontibacter sp. H249]|uniref:hypothetical protein n=1 Tax=Pontibacter sp. H249 TaxID=3133420 RepID=UPI0030BC50FA